MAAAGVGAVFLGYSSPWFQAAGLALVILGVLLATGSLRPTIRSSRWYLAAEKRRAARHTRRWNLKVDASNAAYAASYAALTRTADALDALVADPSDERWDELRDASREAVSGAKRLSGETRETAIRHLRPLRVLAVQRGDPSAHVGNAAALRRLVESREGLTARAIAQLLQPISVRRPWE